MRVCPIGYNAVAESFFSITEKRKNTAENISYKARCKG